MVTLAVDGLACDVLCFLRVTARTITAITTQRPNTVIMAGIRHCSLVLKLIFPDLL